MVIGFFLFKHLVYASDKKNNVAKEVGKYLIVNASSLLVTLAVSILLKDSLFPYVGFLFQPEDTAHFIGVFLGAVSNYFGHKIFTFA